MAADVDRAREAVKAAEQVQDQTRSASVRATEGVREVERRAERATATLQSAQADSERTRKAHDDARRA